MPEKPPFRRVFIVVACSALIVTLSMGVRQSFGLFLEPISGALFGGERETVSLALAVQNLLLGLPLIGLLADRIGPRWVVLSGGLLYATGLALLPNITDQAGLQFTLGLIVGLALSGTTYVVVLGAVAQVVPPAARSTAFGITTAAGSFGMFALVPFTQSLVSGIGWQAAVQILAVIVGVVVLLAFGLPRTASNSGPQRADEQAVLTLGQTLANARTHRGYWLLNAGFFVCGFHVAFIATHLPAFLNGNGIPPLVSATALGLIGFANIFGSYLFGMLGDRLRKKYLLGFLYLARSIVIGLFLVVPLSPTSTLVFAGVIGFLWLATVPLTSGMVAQIFGSRYLSTLYGIVFFSHQIGSFLGVWLGGRVYDATGSYNAVWIAAVVLGLIAAVIHLPISERPVQGAPIALAATPRKAI